MRAEAGSVTSVDSSYRGLFAITGVSRITAGLLLGRIGASMWQLVLVLFVLERFHSPALAGLSVVAGQVPGKVVSPLAGALLDRYGRSYLVLVDYALGAALIGAIAGLSAAGLLSSGALIGLLLLAGTTQPLSQVGMRSIFPILIPRRLWDRANALDSGTELAATLIGPALGGAIIGIAGTGAGVATVAAIFAGAALATFRLGDPAGKPASAEGLFSSAWRGLRYVASNPTLRGLVVVVALLNARLGVLLVAIPVLVQHQFGGSASLTGVIFALYGLGGLLSGTLVGRHNSELRERSFIVAGSGLMAVGTLLLAVPGPLAFVFLGVGIAGLGVGPTNTSMFGLRQRRIPPEMLGRALAVSMALNGLGIPLGAAVAGGLCATGQTDVAFIAGGLMSLCAVGLSVLLIPFR
jgi:MFS family permease